MTPARATALSFWRDYVWAPAQRAWYRLEMLAHVAQGTEHDAGLTRFWLRPWGPHARHLVLVELVELVLAAAALGRPMAMGTTVMEAVDARRGFESLPDGIPVGLRSAIQPLLALDPKDRPQYVDRLFVVPDGGPANFDSGVQRAPSPRRPQEADSEGSSSRAGLFAALGARCRKRAVVALTFQM